jgi:thiosulfate/3-mercaptopyruvate sulfurtransferase
MLNGGLRKWQADGHNLETKTNGFKPAKFDGRINPQVVADYEYINKNLDKLKLIDARSKE